MSRLGARITGAMHAIRDEGVTRFVTKALRRRRIKYMRYWWVREQLPSEIPAELTTLPAGLAFRMLTEADLPQLLTFPARGAPMEERHLTGAFARAESCLGVVRGDEIVGFGWWSLKATHTHAHPATMAPHEAYLHNMYVLPELRGLRLAPIIRYRTYQMLAAEGRNSFYSITDVSNIPSWRFKEKLGATKVLMGVYLALGWRWRWRMTLRRYR